MVSLLEINIMAALLIIFICIIRAAFGKLLPKRLFTALWLVVVLRLAIPFGVPVSLGFVPHTFRIPMVVEMRGEVQYGYYDEIEEETVYIDGMSLEKAERARNTRANFDIATIIVFSVTFSALLIEHLLNRRRLSDSLPCDDEKIKEYIHSYGLKRNVRVLVSDRINAPVTFGIFRPVIVLPKNAEGDLSAVIAHEIAHIKYFDVLYKLVTAGVLCAFWYNPFVWLMFLLSGRDIEIACDSFAMNYCKCSGESYAELLINFEEKRSLDYLTGGFSARALKTRIRHIMKSRKVGAAGVFTGVVIAALSLSAFASAHSSINRTGGEFDPVYWSRDGQYPLLWIEPQRYYREDDPTQYIEFYDDNTFQMFGYDYMAEYEKDLRELNPDLTEEEVQVIVDDERYGMDNLLFGKRSKYKVSRTIPVIMTMDDNRNYSPTGSIEYSDENTLIFKNAVFKAENPWHTDIRCAPDSTLPNHGTFMCTADAGYIHFPYYDYQYEVYDESGVCIDNGHFQPLHIGSEKEVMLSVNADNIPKESPRGWWYDAESGTITDSETGKIYIEQSRAIFS